MVLKWNTMKKTAALLSLLLFLLCSPTTVPEKNADAIYRKTIPRVSIVDSIFNLSSDSSFTVLVDGSCGMNSPRIVQFDSIGLH